MRKDVKHSRNLNRMANEPGLLPRHRLLCEMLLLALDHQDSPLGERYLRLTEKVFSGKANGKEPNMYAILEDDEEPAEDTSSVLKSVFESIETKE